MQGPDALDRVQYMPPDKVKQLHQSDPDKRQKFSRALEEEEEEARKRQKKQPHDAVELNLGEAAESETHEEPSEQPEAEREDNTESDKHIDLKA